MVFCFGFFFLVKCGGLIVRIVFFCSAVKQVLVKECSAVPRVGEHVGLFYQPCPRVTSVVWFPEMSWFKIFGYSDVVGDEPIEVLVEVD